MSSARDASRPPAADNAARQASVAPKTTLTCTSCGATCSFATPTCSACGHCDEPCWGEVHVTEEYPGSYVHYCSGHREVAWQTGHYVPRPPEPGTPTSL